MPAYGNEKWRKLDEKNDAWRKARGLKRVSIEHRPRRKTPMTPEEKTIYFREYRAAHRADINAYNADWMRRYRKAKRKAAKVKK